MLSKENAPIILRSSLGLYSAQLPSRLTIIAIYSFFFWIALFFCKFDQSVGWRERAEEFRLQQHIQNLSSNRPFAYLSRFVAIHWCNSLGRLWSFHDRAYRFDLLSGRTGKWLRPVHLQWCWWVPWNLISRLSNRHPCCIGYHGH